MSNIDPSMGLRTYLSRKRKAGSARSANHRLIDWLGITGVHTKRFLFFYSFYQSLIEFGQNTFQDESANLNIKEFLGRRWSRMKPPPKSFLCRAACFFLLRDGLYQEGASLRNPTGIPKELLVGKNIKSLFISPRMSNVKNQNEMY